MTVHKGRLTASVQDSPIGSVLEELDSQTDVALIPAEDLDIAEHRISAQLADVPPDEGLRRLLKDYDTFFITAVWQRTFVPAGRVDIPEGDGLGLATASARSLGKLEGTGGKRR
jgi:hypothetical protein